MVYCDLFTCLPNNAPQQSKPRGRGSRLVPSLRVLTWLSPKLSSAKKFNPGVSILRKVLLLSTTVRSESCPRRSERSRNSKVLCSLLKAANNKVILYVNSCVLINVNNEYQKQVTGTALKHWHLTSFLSLGRLEEVNLIASSY